jgi:hypothetical protein
MTGSGCPAPEELSGYASLALGNAPGRGDHLVANVARARMEAHAAECARCRRQLAALGATAEPETADEAAAIERLEGSLGGIPELLDAAARRAGPDALFFESASARPVETPAAGSALLTPVATARAAEPGFAGRPRERGRLRSSASKALATARRWLRRRR